MTLRDDFHRQFIKAMEANKRIQTDIINGTSHSASFVSELVNGSKNHCLDTLEPLANAVYCKAEIRLIPFTDEEIKAYNKENGHLNNKSKSK